MRSSVRHLVISAAAAAAALLAPDPAPAAQAYTAWTAVVSLEKASNAVGAAINKTHAVPATSTDEALRALSVHVRRSSHGDALRTAFSAYYNYRAANPTLVTRPYLYYVDLGLDNRTARGWVFDMDQLEVVEGPFAVAHGRGSSRQRDGVPVTFSNRPGSYASSLGLYLAQETYSFSGRAGGGSYTSVGLRMRGESGEFNSAARQRGIVAHGAPYVTAGEAGRSEGCPAMEQHRARRLLPLIANGGIVFIYSPNDHRWLAGDPWVNGDAGTPDIRTSPGTGGS